MVHMASSQRSRGREVKDGRFDGVGCGVVEVRPNYPLVVVVFISAHMGILVFCFRIQIEPYGCYERVCESGSLSHPIYLRFSFLSGVGMLHVIRKRGEK
jgi:hypothetical protein